MCLERVKIMSNKHTFSDRTDRNCFNKHHCQPRLEYVDVMLCPPGVRLPPVLR